MPTQIGHALAAQSRRVAIEITMSALTAIVNPMATLMAIVNPMAALKAIINPMAVLTAIVTTQWPSEPMVALSSH
ncbi:hypothetical protein PCANC_28790 [Puccinia coronata f. sp. avenae]|uniref:Uncharacterized protein n=1 Tax=Puccinia coronata f. sp. avenae TaxID=200324 RepID=A0A2N5TB10_9BASI|nr:hypothetical protein PCANC_28790 [Puccinia coronata f. sp. avenae]